MRHQDFRNSRRRDSDADTYNPQPRVFGTRPRFSQARFEGSAQQRKVFVEQYELRIGIYLLFKQFDASSIRPPFFIE